MSQYVQYPLSACLNALRELHHLLCLARREVSAALREQLVPVDQQRGRKGTRLTPAASAWDIGPPNSSLGPSVQKRPPVASSLGGIKALPTKLPS